MMAGQLLRFAAPQLTSLQQWRGLAPIFGGLAARWACTGAESAAIIVPMPKLSPSMTVGTVSKWLKGPGDAIAEFDVVMEVDTEGLTEEAYKVGEFAGNVTLLVEAQEEGYLHSILVKEGEQVPVGTPVALMAELEESLPGLDGYKLPVSNVYMEGASSTVRALSWQSYLKSDEGSSSRGCD